MGYLDSFRMGAGPRGKIYVIIGIEPFSPTSDLWGGEREWRLNSSTSGLKFSKSCLCHDASRLGTHWCAGKVVHSKRAWKPCALLTPIPSLCNSSIWLFLSCILYNKAVGICILLSSVSCSSNLTNLRRGHGNLWFITNCSNVQGVIWDLWLVSELRAVFYISIL